MEEKNLSARGGGGAKTSRAQQQHNSQHQLQYNSQTEPADMDDISSCRSGSVRPPNFSDMDSEAPLSQAHSSQFGMTEYFTESSEAAQHLQDTDFQDLYDRFNQLLEEEENNTEEAAPDLPPEDDNGNTEYKLKLCGLSMYKVKKRTTQMAFRLTEGKGEAFYEVGVHDNGELIGISYEDCAETVLVLFHISNVLQAKLEVLLVRLGIEGYSVQLRVSKPQPEAIEPEVDAFIMGLNILKSSRTYESVKRQRSESAPVIFDDSDCVKKSFQPSNGTDSKKAIKVATEQMSEDQFKIDEEDLEAALKGLQELNLENGDTQIDNGLTQTTTNGVKISINKKYMSNNQASSKGIDNPEDLQLIEEQKDASSWKARLPSYSVCKNCPFCPLIPQRSREPKR